MKCLYYSIIYNIILKNYPFVPLIGTVIVSRYCSAPYLVADLFVLEIGGGELCELYSVFDQSGPKFLAPRALLSVCVLREFEECRSIDQLHLLKSAVIFF